MNRAERRHRTKKVVAKRLKLLKAVQSTQYTHMHKVSGMFRDRHPFDCGKPHCYVCHGDKYLGKKHKASTIHAHSAEEPHCDRCESCGNSATYDAVNRCIRCERIRDEELNEI